jgi:hypothetical protein
MGFCIHVSLGRNQIPIIDMVALEYVTGP